MGKNKKSPQVFLQGSLVGEDGFEPSKHKATDLQSAPFGHSGILPYNVVRRIYYFLFISRTVFKVRHKQSAKTNHRFLFRKCSGLKKLVDGLEPPTCWLQISCSTNWATPAFQRYLLYHILSNLSSLFLNFFDIQEALNCFLCQPTCLLYHIVLCLSSGFWNFFRFFCFPLKVEATGLEPAASWSQTKHSTKLSYASLMLYYYITPFTFCQAFFQKNYDFFRFLLFSWERSL